MRALSAHELRNASALRGLVGDVAYLMPTQTGLGKGIMDAVAPLRAFLKDHDFHDYDEQEQGEAHKLVVAAVLVTDELLVDTKASLYRPTTKQGDPRIWIHGLARRCSPGAMLAIFVHEEVLYAYDLTAGDIAEVLASHGAGQSLGAHPVFATLGEIRRDDDHTARELLIRLRSIAGRGWVEAVGHGPTAVGRTLETHLGIPPNSSKEPDYKGIELKAARRKTSGKDNRQPLFAQVPDWEISLLKSSRDILDRFGYVTDKGVERFTVQVDHGRPNSKGVALLVDYERDLVHEVDCNSGRQPFVTWRLGRLRLRLAEKHGATFWVEAEARKDAFGVEQFKFVAANYSRNPFGQQFAPLISSGAISLDHLIKRTVHGGAHEQGPLWKIHKDRLSELFPPMQRFELDQ